MCAIVATTVFKCSNVLYHWLFYSYSSVLMFCIIGYFIVSSLVELM